MKRRRPTSSAHQLLQKNRSIRPAFEKLEGRVMLAADLAITNAYLADINAAQIPSVVIGDSVVVRVNYTTSGMDSSMHYKVRMELDGVPIESQLIDGASGNGLQWYRFLKVGYAASGSHQVRVTLDPDNQVAESNESNNVILFNFTPTATNIPVRLLTPVPGGQSSPWTLVNYVDNDLRVGQMRDHRGGFMTYDNEEGMDFFLSDFRSMDQGWPILAAADGVVIEVDDGNFDREDFWDFTLPDPRISNRVKIDHGNGWQSWYYHIQRDTVAVTVGETVTAGQTLGLIGSSGISDGAHLHFLVVHNGLNVDPFQAPTQYFVSPPEYVRDRAPVVTAIGMTDRDPNADLRYGQNEIHTFALSGPDSPYMWFRMDYISAGDQITTDWLRPDGSLYYHDVWNSVQDFRFFAFWTRVFTVDMSGPWIVASSLNGTEIARQSFNVVTGLGEPEIDLRSANGKFVNDGQTTPIDFGSVAQFSAAPQRNLTIKNVGTAPLNISAVVIPAGFELVGAAPTTLGVDQSATLTIRMLTAQVDHLWGEIVLTSHDADESTYTFAVEGTVTGSVNPNAPQLTARTTGLPIQQGEAWVHVFPDLQALDADTTDFSDGTLTATLASGALEDGTDRLGLSMPDSDWQLVQGSIFYQGTQIAFLAQDGSTGTLAINFVGAVDVALVQQLARSIIFWQQSASLSYRRRIVQLNLTDPSGLESASLYRAVYYSNTSLNQAPQLAGLANRTVAEDTALSSIDLPLSDLNDALSTLTVTAASSDNTIIADSSIQVVFSAGKWQLTATPVLNANGKCWITITAEDPDGATATGHFLVTVTAQNDLPNISNITDKTTQLGLAPITVPFQISDVETSADLLQLSATSSNSLLIPVSGIVFGGTGANRTVTLNSAAVIGQSTIIITVTDGDGGQRSDSFVLRVNNETTPPTITPIPDIQILEDGSGSADFAVSDNVTAANQLQLSASSNNAALLPPGNISITGADENRSVVMSPEPNAFGTAEVVIFAMDAAGNVGRRTFTVTVQPVNDAPSFTVVSRVDVDEDAGDQVINITGITSGDELAQPIHLELAASNSDLFELLSLEHSGQAQSGRITFKSKPEMSGSSDLVFTLTDGGLDNDLETIDDNLTVVQTVSLFIHAVNDPPSDLILPEMSLPEDTIAGALSIVQVVDPDDTSFTFTCSDSRFAIQNGELRLLVDQQLDYETEPTIALGITVQDSAGAEFTKSFEIHVRDVNESPTAIEISAYSLYQLFPDQVIGALTVSDPDIGQTHSIESLDSRFVVTAGELKLASGVIISGGIDEIVVPLRVGDSGTPPIIRDFDLTLAVTAVESPWKNPHDSLDVSANSLITPTDALLIINFLNSTASRILDPVSSPPTLAGPFLDVSGDKFISPTDALLVINYLNSRPNSGGEGESSQETYFAFSQTEISGVFDALPKSLLMASELSMVVRLEPQTAIDGHQSRFKYRPTSANAYAETDGSVAGMAESTDAALNELLLEQFDQVAASVN